MNIEDKKRIAVWMGWSVDNNPRYNYSTKHFKARMDRDPKLKYAAFSLFLGIFNPDSPKCPHSVWAEIWERMTDEEFEKYACWLMRLIKTKPEENYPKFQRELLTTSTAIMSVALLEIISEKAR